MLSPTGKPLSLTILLFKLISLLGKKSLLKSKSQNEFTIYFNKNEMIPESVGVTSRIYYRLP